MGASQQLELADRLANLGTETAFAVSKAAAEWAAACLLYTSPSPRD